MISRQNIDIQFMKRALALAKNGIGTVSPNPIVGAIVVKDNIILGEGYHIRSGQGHAEVNAIRNCGDKNIEGATIYVTLEPCCHTNKKTPPCTDLILEKKIQRVVVACLDANPLVAGNGIKILKDHGLDVIHGVLEKEAKKLNEIFFKYINSKIPFVEIKLAQTLDGKMATLSGDSKWISSEACRREVHEMRLKYDGVMIGRHTLQNDNPSLDIRMGIDSKGKIPWRIIVGDPSKMNFNLKILSDEHCDKTVIVTKNANFEIPNTKIKRVIFKNNVEEALGALCELGITSILLEGGPNLVSYFLGKNLFDKITIYIAPKIIGEGISYFNKKFDLMDQALTFSNVKVTAIDNHAKIEMDKLCSQAL